MKLSLRNIGKVKEADVEINGITVIAGENDTGKSTVGKALFSVFNCFYDIDMQIKKNKTYSLAKLINNTLSESNTNNPRHTSLLSVGIINEYLIENINEIEDENISSLVLGSINHLNDVYFTKFEAESLPDNLTNLLSEVFEIPDEIILQELLSDRIYIEFNSQANNIFSTEAGEITLTIKNNPIHIKIFENEIQEAKGEINLRTEAVYIDSPFILDDTQMLIHPVDNNAKQLYNHRNHLKNKIYKKNQDTNIITKIMVSEKFDAIFNKVNVNFDGYFLNPRRPTIQFKKTGEIKPLNIKNLSTGMKTFLIIKMLLLNETIQHNGTIILDEPEIHLHPEWQLLFAELIVLIQKEFNMHILMTTHSPYFLRAIQIYAAKHEVVDKCKYYLADLIDDEAYIKDVSDDIEQIYKKLFVPLQRLEDERWDND